MDILLLTRASVKLCLDLFMIFKFKVLFAYFAKLKYKWQGYSQSNLGVILCTYILMFLNGMLSAFGICHALYLVSFTQDQPQVLIPLRIMIRPFSYTIIFLTLCGLLYLFHHLGLKHRSKSQAP